MQWLVCSDSDTVTCEIKIDDLSEKRASAQILIEQHSYFIWLYAKAWKQSLLRVCYDSELIAKKFASEIEAKSVANELKAMYRLALTGQALIFNIQIFEQSATQNNHVVCYWPTIHNLMSKICPNFPSQVLSFHFSEVDELLKSILPKLC